MTEKVVEGDDVVGLASAEDDAHGRWVVRDGDGLPEGVLVVGG